MSVDFVLRETGANLRRHGLAALASVTTTAFCLFILGGFVLGLMMLQRFSASLLNQTSVVAYVNPSVAETASRDLARQVEGIAGVKAARWVSKTQAWEEEKKKYGHMPELDTMANPLGDELRISLAFPEKSDAVAKSIAALEGVDTVNSGGDVAKRLSILHNVLRFTGSAASAGLLCAAMFIIGNAIRLGVFSRRREIRIMKLVGATDGFIRFPFLLEGLLHGLAGAFLASVALGAAAQNAATYLAHSLPFLPLSAEGLSLAPLFAALFVVGGVLGLSGSYLSVRRFLKAAG